MLLPAVALLLVLSAGAARADEGTEIDCKKTDLSFEAPGYTVKCTDYSRSSISVGELNAASQTYVLFATSEADITFLQAYSKHVLGGTRIYINRRSLESELEDSFSFKFSRLGRRGRHWRFRSQACHRHLRIRRALRMRRFPQARRTAL